MKNYIIYKHTNKITGKSYIGLTSKSIEGRWKEHIYTSREYNGHTRKFLLAIKKYGIHTWDSCILKDSLTKDEAIEAEIYYIKVYNTYINGYNSTLGGDLFNGYIPPKGDSHPVTDKKVYTFYSRNTSSISTTVHKFASKYNLDTRSVRALINRRNVSLFGWVVNPINLYIPGLIKPPSITNVSVKPKTWKICPICNKTTIRVRNKTCIKCRDTKGQNNPMYGKERPDYVKEAVSLRKRSEADPTRRTWQHTSGLIEKDITCIELRDKYTGLSISKLNAIAKKLKNNKGYLIGVSHKGWRVINET